MLNAVAQHDACCLGNLQIMGCNVCQNAVGQAPSRLLVFVPDQVCGYQPGHLPPQKPVPLLELPV
jgi:hypothetical protein